MTGIPMTAQKQPRKKILFLITKSTLGGAQRYVCDLALHLDHKRFEPVVAAGGDGALMAELRAARIRTISLKHAARDVALLRELRLGGELLRLIASERPDILHVNSSKLGGLGALIGRLLMRRVIFTAHGWPFHEAHRSRLWRASAYVLSWLTSVLAHATITISELDRRAAMHFLFARGKIAHVPLGIQAPAFLSRADARRRLNLPLRDDAFSIGMIGELTANKDYRTALDALCMFDDESRRTLRLVIIGDGEDADDLRAYAAARGLTEHVIFAGEIPHASRCLRAFDCFLLTSRKEGLPYVLLEAGHAGLPVVAANVGGIPDLISHKSSGLLVPPANPAALAETLATLLADEEMGARLGEALKQRVQSDFTLARMVADTEALYERVHK